MAAPASGHPYCIEAVDKWLRQWELLEALAESPRTSVHHLNFDHAGHSGPCSDGPRGRGGRRSDGLAFADLRADLASAVARLPAGSLGRQVVEERIRAGGSLKAVARRLGRRCADVAEAYHAAIAVMSEALGAEAVAS